MAAALTIVLLFTLSFLVVRVAVVAMRHTGLPETVARFQCISALTGTGFSTSESEMIVNYPVRRRIILTVMILGNLGLASVSATFIVSMLEAESSLSSIVVQVALIGVAISITMFVMMNKRLDKAMCDVISYILAKTTFLGSRQYLRILQLDGNLSIAEHIYLKKEPMLVKDLGLKKHELVILSVRAKNRPSQNTVSDSTKVSFGEVLIIYGHDDMHDEFAAAWRAIEQGGE